MDSFRIRRMKQIMSDQKIDALFLRLPENIIYLTGYWSVIGASALYFPLEGDPILFAPEDETPYVEQGWERNVRYYKYFNVKALSNPNRDISALFLAEKDKLNLKGRTIGYEGSFECVACNHVRAETRVATVSTLRMLEELLPECRLVDATAAIIKSRAVKSPAEIEALKLACEVTGFGYIAAKKMLRPGLKETEIAMAIESEIHIAGVGYKGLTRAQGFAFVMGGENSVNAWRPFVFSSDYAVKNGDVVLLEVDAYADGYFVDLTRTYAIGEPTERQMEIYDIVRLAQKEALKGIKPGVRAADVDGIAQKVIEEAGLARYRRHHLGHGVGFQFHDPKPTLLPVSEDILEKGMTFAVEPALYVPGVGGLRVEDNVVVTETGFEYLSVLNDDLK
jgi:Xaa-Pro aminopeptidase